jgi:tRNA G18 (ribose-2'-O)-methylase SpoU
MELKLESFNEEEVINEVEITFEGRENEEEEKEKFRYFTREAAILPVNERTLQKRREREAEEELKKLEKENLDRQAVEEKLHEIMSQENHQRAKEELEAKRKWHEKRLQEEAEELEHLVG